MIERPLYALIWDGGIIRLYKTEIPLAVDIHAQIADLIDAGVKRVSLCMLTGLDGWWVRPYDWHEFSD